jgi:hypothetical protein
MMELTTEAVESISVRLMVSIAILSAIIILVGYGFHYVEIVGFEAQLRNECATFESLVLSMIYTGVARDVDEPHAAEGTTRVHTFCLPETLIYLGFGIDPDPNNDAVLEPGYTYNSSVLFYRVHGGSKQVIWFLEGDCGFRKGDFVDGRWIINKQEQGFLLTNGGVTTLVFELVEKNSVRYILIHAHTIFEI